MNLCDHYGHGCTNRFHLGIINPPKSPYSQMQMRRSYSSNPRMYFSYRVRTGAWKTLKVLEFYWTIFKTLKVLECHWKVLEKTYIFVLTALKDFILGILCGVLNQIKCRLDVIAFNTWYLNNVLEKHHLFLEMSLNLFVK